MKNLEYFQQNFTVTTSRLRDFSVLFQYFGKYQAKSNIDDKFCRILVKFH